MENPDNQDSAEQAAGSQPAPAFETPNTSASSFHSHTERQTCAERTGELVEAVADVIEGRHRAIVQLAQEPGINVLAPIIINADNVRPLSASTFDEYRVRPRQLQATPALTRIESFINLVNRHKVADSVIFAQESAQQPAMQAIIDYHEESDGLDLSLPHFGQHVISYPFPLSKEWKTWIAKNSQPMGMTDFAEFIEENIVNVEAVPLGDLSKEAQGFIAKARGKLADPTELYTLSRGLSVNENSRVVQTTNLATGEGQVIFQSEHVDDAGAPISIPNMFVIVIPIWDKSPDFYRIVARLRYRKQGGSLSFWYELWRADLSFQTAFDEVVAQVEAETSLPVFIGRA